MNRYLLLLFVLGSAVDCRVADAQSAPSAPSCFAWNESSPSVRAEGLAELVSDIHMVCSARTPVSSGAAIPAFDLKLTFNANVTSRIFGTDGVSSEALLLLDESSPDAQFPCE